MSAATSNVKPQPVSTGATQAAHTSPWVPSHPNKQKTNTQQRERKRPKLPYTQPGTWQANQGATSRGALHPLRGAAPVTWCCTRSERVQCLQIGCNAYRSGVPRSQARTREEPGISQREGKRSQRPYTQPGTWQANQADTSCGHCTCYGALHPLRGAAPDQNGCNAYGSGAMPTDRVYRARRQERVRNLESRNAKERGLNAPTHNPGLGRPIKRIHHAGTAPVTGRCTRYVVLHPIRTGAMPTDRVQCLPIGCTALAGKNA